MSVFAKKNARMGAAYLWTGSGSLFLHPHGCVQEGGYGKEGLEEKGIGKHPDKVGGGGTEEPTGMGEIAGSAISGAKRGGQVEVGR